MKTPVSQENAMKAAYIYARTGSAEAAGRVINRSGKTVRQLFRTYKDKFPEMLELVEAGRELALEKGYRQALAKRRCTPYQVRNDLALRRDREILQLRASVPSPVTIGQKLMGEPLPGRSALDKVNANNRRDDAETDPRFIRRVFGSDNSRRNVVTLPNIQLSQTI